MSKSLPILAYWNTRGVAQPIRLLLKYLGVPFVDKRYPFGAGTSIKDINSVRKEWYAVKFTLGLDFPNLPYYIDGDVKMTQSLAILRYLGRKHNLFADNERSLIRQDMIELEMHDLFFSSLRPFLLQDFNEKTKQEYIAADLGPRLARIDKYSLLSDGKWSTGNKLSYVDFLAYEYLDWVRQFDREMFETNDNLKRFVSRVERLPTIHHYLHSPGEFNEWPLLSPLLKWGYWR